MNLLYTLLALTLISCSSLEYKPFVEMADVCFENKSGDQKCIESNIYSDPKRFHSLNSLEHESLQSLIR